MAKWLVLVWLGLAVACGDDSGAVDSGMADVGLDGASDAGDDAGADAGEDAGDDAGMDDAGGDVGADAPGTCDDLITTLQAELYAEAWTCSVVVRLDHDSLAMLGHQVICGSYDAIDESAARLTAMADTGYGEGGTMLNSANPEDTFVFYEAPGDFGGMAAVNARHGLTVFGGSIVWSGAGDITYPTEWRSPDALGSDCPIVGEEISAVGYDLVGGGALDADDVDAAVAVVRSTAVPGAFWGGGYLFDAVVLRYPRSVGVFDPTTAEWIVIVNGGWLE